MCFPRSSIFPLSQHNSFFLSLQFLSRTLQKGLGDTYYTFKLQRKTMIIGDEYNDEEDGTHNREDNGSLAKAHEIEETEHKDKERRTEIYKLLKTKRR